PSPPANHAQPQTDFDAVFSHARHRGLELFGSISHSQQARALREGQTLGLLRMAGDIDFGSSATRSDERRVQPSFFDSIVFAVEINLTSVSPEGATDRQEFSGACVPLVVREKITVAVLLRLRAARDDVQGDAPADECGEGIDLLYESRRLHKARAVGDDELELRRGLAERA